MRFETTLKERPERPDQRAIHTLRLLFDGQRIVEAPAHVLAFGVTALGRAPDGPTRVVLTDPRVSRQHAELRLSKGTLILTDRSSTGTRVNGEPVHAVELEDGDLIGLGDALLLYRISPDPLDDATLAEILGVAPATAQLRASLATVGATDASVLLLGESGTGKELAARALHEVSRRHGALVAVNCGAIPEQLAEAQLFGHVAGAYTGAREAGTGFFRAANGGTLFLDEIGELPLTLQPKLLRALETREVIPVGSTAPVRLDLRIVAATHRDLPSDVAAGSFRGDLYARLAEIELRLPPLRRRREDVLPLLAHAYGAAPAPCLTPELASAMLHHDWPYNVREVYKVATQLRVRGQGATLLGLEMLDGRLAGRVAPPLPSDAGPLRSAQRATPSTDRLRPTGDAGGDAGAQAVPDRAELEALLRAHRGVIADIARASGRSRKQVYRWLERYGLRSDDYRG